MASWLPRIFHPFAKGSAVEGQYRPGPYLLNDGWLSAQAGKYWNWWQNGYSLQPYGERSAMVEACVAAYSQTVAMCPGSHWRKLDNNGRERVTNSDLSRILKQPNDYQSISDFLMNLTRRLYSHGEAFALVIRNARGEISEIHQMWEGIVRLAPEGDIFYQLGCNEIVESRFDLTIPFPARDVLHVRLHTPKHPLKGVSPILATTADQAMAGAVLDQQTSYYMNQARPSFILETDMKLNKDERDELKRYWNLTTQGDHAGETPLLTYGIKARPVTTTARDGQLAEMRKLSDQAIAMAFRLPLQVLGVGGVPFASTEALMQSWISQGLGFCINHIELAFDTLFRLRGQPDEYTQFDTAVLLRSAFKERIDGLVAGVMGGVMSSDEARAEMELPKTEGGYGAMCRVQQQVVPLKYGFEMQPPDPNPPPVTNSAPQDQQQQDEAQTKRLLQYFTTEADAHARYAA